MDDNATIKLLKNIQCDLDSLKKRIELLEERIVIQSFKNELYLKNIRSYHRMFDQYILWHLFEKDNQYDSFKCMNIIREIISNAKYPVVNLNQSIINKQCPQLNIIFKHNNIGFDYDFEHRHPDLICLWGGYPQFEKTKLLAYAKYHGVPFFVAEDGFLESVIPNLNHNALEAKATKYDFPHSITVDSYGFYYFAQQPSGLEMMLNSSYKLNHDELKRTKKLIQMIVDHKISKYNHQPIFNNILQNSIETNVLIIDQVYGDFSIYGALADDSVFDTMLSSALQENPNSIIYIKTHPVTNATSAKGHFHNISTHPRICILDYEINPFSLLESMDKVYVCSSTMGFEALLCGKEVHVFGMPFYAGWGQTYDRIQCLRRTKNRSVEEIFYMAYIMYSIYASFETKNICDIEIAIDEILRYREEYWLEMEKHKSRELDNHGDNND